MNKKFNFRKICVLLLGACVILLTWRLIASMAFLGEQNNGIGIIGGADGPTAIFVTTRIWAQFFNVATAFLAAIAVTCCLGLVFSKSVTENCTWKTSAVSLAASGIFSLGAYCALTAALALGLGGLQKYPVRIPVGIALGAACFLALVGVIAYYSKLRLGKASVKGVVLDVVFALLYVVPFLYAFTWLDTILIG